MNEMFLSSLPKNILAKYIFLHRLLVIFFISDRRQKMENIKEGKESDIDGDKLISVFFFKQISFWFTKELLAKQRHGDTKAQSLPESESPKSEHDSHAEIFLPSGFTVLSRE